MQQPRAARHHSRREMNCMLTLYDYGNSVCCQKVRITLCEKGLDWDAIRVDLFASEQYDPKYLKLNPKGVVPTLVHDGVLVIESTLICEYLDETFPDPPLAPRDAAQRAQMRLWSKFVDEGLFEGVTEISFSAMFRERMKTMAPEMRERRFQKIGAPRRRGRVRPAPEPRGPPPLVFFPGFPPFRALHFLVRELGAPGPG